MNNNIKNILFYKREIDSIEIINLYNISFTDKKILIYKNNSLLSQKDLNSHYEEKIKELLSYLDEYKKTKYQIELFEVDTSDLLVKYYIIINYQNKQYFAFKACKPFSQKYYQEILNILLDLINQ